MSNRAAVLLKFLAVPALAGTLVALIAVLLNFGDAALYALTAVAGLAVLAYGVRADS